MRSRRRGVGALVTVLFALTVAVVGSVPGAGASAGGPRAGGSITYLDEALAWPTLDPVSATYEGTDQPIMSLIYGNLFDVGPNNAILPDLALSATTSDHGLLVTLKLRPHVVFQDGTPFNAAAVAENLERDTATGSGCLCLAALKTLTSVTTPTNLTVAMHFSAPDGVLVPALATSSASFIISPAALASQGSSYGNSPVGAGPYKVTANTPNSTMTLQRFPSYWNARHVYLSTITVTSVATGSAGLDSVESGQAQIFFIANDPPTRKTAESDHALTEVSNDLYANFLYMDFKTAPFDNKLAREAVQDATNPRLIDQTIYDGDAPPSQTLLGPDELASIGTKIPGYKGYNLAEAKKLVAQLGGLSFTQITFATSPIDELVAESLQRQWAAAGIVSTVDPTPPPTALSELEGGTYQALVAGYPPNSNDTPLTLANSVVCPVYFSPGFCDPNASGLVQRALETTSLTAQATLMKKAVTDVVVNDAAYVPLNSTPDTVILDKTVKNFGYYGGMQYLSGVWVS